MVLECRKEAGESEEDPHRLGEDVQTPSKKDPSPRNQTNNLLALVITAISKPEVCVFDCSDPGFILWEFEHPHCICVVSLQVLQLPSTVKKICIGREHSEYKSLYCSQVCE